MATTPSLLPLPCWKDPEGVTHERRELTQYTMCHRWIVAEISHGIPVVKGLTDDAPNCLRCITIHEPAFPAR